MSDLQNPLFLHPSEGPKSLFIQEKLKGANNYRSWRRNLEIGLATKRKLGFVQCQDLMMILSKLIYEVKSFLQALTKQKEEQRLLQFLNDLDEKYGTQRSQLPLMTPLPTIETACSRIQQEESQREVLEINKLEVETTALYSRNEKFKDVKICTEYGNRRHTLDKCRSVIGYPAWHPKGKKQLSKKGDKPFSQFRGKGKFAAAADTATHINPGSGLTQQRANTKAHEVVTTKSHSVLNKSSHS
ncbi:hypothetical protein Cgig2_017896 [Carnegiea gigantea]|uniref:Retrotransposon Copia-like N-terminal domain-containing protein n=1 Tax=Carnegiea gigantea TaxID=171969 RepID=A0A9Q1GMJ0_9CARY|nr:hypothetical protein Cgig2_017896 [Carnegiea gigantea]